MAGLILSNNTPRGGWGGSSINDTSIADTLMENGFEGTGEEVMPDAPLFKRVTNKITLRAITAIETGGREDMVHRDKQMTLTDGDIANMSNKLLQTSGTETGLHHTTGLQVTDSNGVVNIANGWNASRFATEFIFDEELDGVVTRTFLNTFTDDNSTFGAGDQINPMSTFFIDRALVMVNHGNGWEPVSAIMLVTNRFGVKEYEVDNFGNQKAVAQTEYAVRREDILRDVTKNAINSHLQGFGDSPGVTNSANSLNNTSDVSAGNMALDSWVDTMGLAIGHGAMRSKMIGGNALNHSTTFGREPDSFTVPILRYLTSRQNPDNMGNSVKQFRFGDIADLIPNGDYRNVSKTISKNDKMVDLSQIRGNVNQEYVANNQQIGKISHMLNESFIGILTNNHVAGANIIMTNRDPKLVDGLDFTSRGINGAFLVAELAHKAGDISQAFRGALNNSVLSQMGDAAYKTCHGVKTQYVVHVVCNTAYDMTITIQISGMGPQTSRLYTTYAASTMSSVNATAAGMMGLTNATTNLSNQLIANITNV